MQQISVGVTKKLPFDDQKVFGKMEIERVEALAEVF